MSQVKFKAIHKGKEVEVLAGWDRPLREFFMSVFNDEGDTIWSTLDMMPGWTQGKTAPLEAQLQEMNIEPPHGFWDIVNLREGNVGHTFKEGKWESW